MLYSIKVYSLLNYLGILNLVLAIIGRPCSTDEAHTAPLALADSIFDPSDGICDTVTAHAPAASLRTLVAGSLATTYSTF